MRAAGKTISAESLSCASPGDDDDDDDDAESIEEDAGGADARRKRKERKEQREVVRLRRLAEKAASRRTGPSAEELRTQKIAEKVAARRAAKAAAEAKGKETKEGVAANTESEPQQKVVTASQADGSDPAPKKLEQEEQNVKQDSRDEKKDKVANVSTNSNGENGTSDAPSGKATKKDAGEAARATNSKGENRTRDAPFGKTTKAKTDAGEAAKSKSEGNNEKKRKGNDASPPRKEHRHDRRQSSRERRSDQTSRSTRGARHGRSRDRDDSRDRGRKDDRARGDRRRSRSARSPRNREDGKSIESKKKPQTEQEKYDQKDAPCENEKEGGSSSSSSSSSDSSAEEEQEEEEQKVCFAWEKGSMIAPSDPMYNMMASGSVSPLAAEVEQFLCIAANVENEAAQRLRVLPAHFQRMVMERGPIAGTTNPTAILMARIRDAELGKTGIGLQGALPQNLPASSNPEIEKMITKWNLDYKASSMLRMLPADKHDVALAIPIDKARNYSAFVIAQLNSLFGGLQGIQDLNKVIALKAGGSDATVRTMAMTNKKKKEPLFMESAVML